MVPHSHRRLAPVLAASTADGRLSAEALQQACQHRSRMPRTRVPMGHPGRCWMPLESTGNHLRQETSKRRHVIRWVIQRAIDCIPHDISLHTDCPSPRDSLLCYAPGCDEGLARRGGRRRLRGPAHVVRKGSQRLRRFHHRCADTGPPQRKSIIVLLPSIRVPVRKERPKGGAVDAGG